MRKILSAVAGLVLAVGFTSMAASASVSASIGCGGGNGASTPCNGQGLGSVDVSGGVASGSVDVAFTSITGLPSSLSGLEVFTPNTDQFNFSFSSVGFSFSNGGTFTFSDITEGGLLSVSGLAEYGTTPSDTSITLVLEATNYTFEGSSGTFSAMGNGTLNLSGDPTVTSMTGSVGLPSVGGGPTPEPGTLLLLGSGLSALGLLRRRLARL